MAQNVLNFQGLKLSELAANNPFLDYRLDVIFTNGDKTYTIPGFYAADGNAAETSGDSGNIWQVRFTPRCYWRMDIFGFL